MTKVIELGNGFWNLRGSYRFRGVLEIGTQMSLVQRANGKYVLLDACALDDTARSFIDEHTNGGADLSAIVHLHPFHTIHVQAVHLAYPKAKLYGTSRHKGRFGDLPWEAIRTEDAAMGAVFADDLEFSVPRGVDFVPSNPNLHFASVLAIHRASKTLHVDDTLCFARLPWILRPFGRELFTFHPTLAKVLQRRAGAVDEFRSWARELITRAESLENACTAHVSALIKANNAGPPIATRIEAAFQRVAGVLAVHAKKYG
jgi:hypothetical protein